MIRNPYWRPHFEVYRALYNSAMCGLNSKSDSDDPVMVLKNKKFGLARTRSDGVSELLSLNICEVR